MQCHLRTNPQDHDKNILRTQIGLHLQEAISLPVLSLFFIVIYCLTVCITGAGSGVYNAWKQKILEARKILEKPHRTPASGGTLYCTAACFKTYPAFGKTSIYRDQFFHHKTTIHRLFLRRIRI